MLIQLEKSLYPLMCLQPEKKNTHGRDSLQSGRKKSGISALLIIVQVGALNCVGTRTRDNKKMLYNRNVYNGLTRHKQSLQNTPRAW